jgi:hypothetical protein
VSTGDRKNFDEENSDLLNRARLKIIEKNTALVLTISFLSRIYIYRCAYDLWEFAKATLDVRYCADLTKVRGVSRV